MALLFLIVFAVVFYALFGAALIGGVIGYSKMFIRAFSFSGKTPRGAYWASLISYIVLFGCCWLYLFLFVEAGKHVENQALCLLMISLFPWIAAGIRRMRDAGVPGLLSGIIVLPQILMWPFSWVMLYGVLHQADKTNKVVMFFNSLPGDEGLAAIYIFFMVYVVSLVLTLIIALFPSSEKGTAVKKNASSEGI